MKKIIIYSLLLILLAAISVASYAYYSISQDNIGGLPEDGVFYIEPESSYDMVFDSLQDKGIIKNANSFDWVAKLMNYKKDIVPSGRYRITENMSNRYLIGMLRSGNQEAVNLTFNNARLIEDLSGKLTANIRLDSISILTALRDEELIGNYGYTPETIMSLFIPNTYKVYWDISAEKLIERMQLEHKKFWNEDRSAKADSMGMTQAEVYTLASIVEKESILSSEKPRIAGLYLNRIERGIHLQADPTVVFAVRGFDLQRVLNKHLAFDSPYNTYIYPGLPPGPIAMASISGIDAVLNAEQHDYLYMCAKPESGGEHAFAETLAGHNQNARIYRNWLSRNGIR